MGKSPVPNTERNAKRPELKLGLPDLEHSKLTVLRSLRAPASRRGNQHAIEEFISCPATRLAGSLNRLSSCSDMPRFKSRNGTSVANSGFGSQRTINSASDLGSRRGWTC